MFLSYHWIRSDGSFDVEITSLTEHIGRSKMDNKEGNEKGSEKW